MSEAVSDAVSAAVFVRAHHCSQRDPMRCYSVASEAVSAALVSVAVSVYCRH